MVQKVEQVPNSGNQIKEPLIHVPPISPGYASSTSFLKDKWKEAAFLFGVTGVSIFVGFSRAISNAKKQEANAFDKIPPKSAAKLHNEATCLALRALKWGTFYAVTGTTLLAFTIWKLAGASNLREFRMKMGNLLPKLSKDGNQGRTEFNNLTELFQYIIDEDEKARKNKPVKSINESPSK